MENKTVDELLQERKDWWLLNEYLCTDEELSSFDRIRLENRLAIEKQVIIWLLNL
jgi:hypothetical protein